jgi:lipopolysaccharide biosynthesis glycosyltransferase
MSTQFAISRFFVPELVRRGPSHPEGRGWAMFCDSDVMCRRPLTELFEYVEQWPDKALFCVHHEHLVQEGEYKMNKQVQTNYARKNWSSVMLFNCDHPANDKVDLKLLNSVPGRDLHRFCWLEDEQIGALHPSWNWLVGVHDQDPRIEPAIAHFTLGSPCLDEYKDVPYADEWHAILGNWAEP